MLLPWPPLSAMQLGAILSRSDPLGGEGSGGGEGEPYRDTTVPS